MIVRGGSYVTRSDWSHGAPYQVRWSDGVMNGNGRSYHGSDGPSCTVCSRHVPVLVILYSTESGVWKCEHFDVSRRSNSTAPRPWNLLRP